MTPLLAARRAVAAAFVASGVLFGSLASRIPALRDQLDLSAAELGLALACSPAGAIVAMPAAGALAARTGSRVATRAGLVLAAVPIALVAGSPSHAALMAAMLLVGAGAGALDVAMNLHGVTVERRLGRAILSRLHAAFSLGGLAGAGAGAVAAGAAVPAGVHLPVAAGAVLATGLVATRALLPGTADRETNPVRLALPPRPVWLLGAVGFAGLLVEGAAADWSGVYLRDETHATAGVAALGVTLFSLTMVAGRLAGDGLVERHGAPAVVRAGAAVAAVGLGAALAAGGTYAGLAGFACVGLGVSVIVPIVFRAAGHVAGVSPALALAAVSTVGYFGFIAGPPAIGLLAGLAGLPGALCLVVALCAAMLPAAGAVRTRT